MSLTPLSGFIPGFINIALPQVHQYLLKRCNSFKTLIKIAKIKAKDLTDKDPSMNFFRWFFVHNYKGTCLGQFATNGYEISILKYKLRSLDYKEPDRKYLKELSRYMVSIFSNCRWTIQHKNLPMF